MNTGSRDEREFLNNVDRIARASERIANAVEQAVYGVTGPEVRDLARQLKEDWAALQERKKP